MNENQISGQDIKQCKLGLYKICWKAGFSSIAILGHPQEGTDDGVVRITNPLVEAIDHIVLLEAHEC